MRNLVIRFIDLGRFGNPHVSLRNEPYTSESSLIYGAFTKAI